jgi:hypothetical protein
LIYVDNRIPRSEYIHLLLRENNEVSHCHLADQDEFLVLGFLYVGSVIVIGESLKGHWICTSRFIALCGHTKGNKKPAKPDDLRVFKVLCTALNQ